MSDQSLETAKEILANNLYMCLATVDGNQPWVSLVYFSLDEKLTFYRDGPESPALLSQG